MTVIRRPADDVETWMNIQRRKTQYVLACGCLVRACAFVEYMSTKESGLPRSSRVMISSLHQISAEELYNLSYQSQDAQTNMVQQ